MRVSRLIIILSFILVISVTACLPTQTVPTPAPTPVPPSVIPTPDDPCLSAKIVSPEGAVREQNAALSKYHVNNEIILKWDMPDCIMTVEIYRQQKLVTKIKDVESEKNKINLGEPGAGVTEIKIWVEGSNTPAHSIWVTVD